MLKSMTGFGSHTNAYSNTIITSEAKTLNSKYLDIALKIPKKLNVKELEIRNIISEHLIRGKVSFTIQLEGDNNSKSLILNRALFNKYLEQYKEIERQSERKFNDILKLSLDSPDVQQTEEEDIEEELWENIKSNIETTLRNCSDARLKEGANLKRVLSDYINTITLELDQIIIEEPKRLAELRARLKTNISDLINSSEFDEDRLEQELIYYSEKLDINEEIERLRIHLQSYLDTLSSAKDQHGKRLGFISQEIGREINTIGSKANSAIIQKHVISMKEELEKIKEQTLNIL